MTAQVVSAPPAIALSSSDYILADVRNHIGHLTLHRPNALNVIDLEMVRCLQAQLNAWAVDDEIYAVVLRGSGDKAFCAGGDIRALYDSFNHHGTLHHDFFAQEYDLDLTLHHYRKPVLALMDGLVLGGGMGLAQAVDLRVVTERSRLGMPEVAIGYFPDVGASYFLSRLPGELGVYLGVTGIQIQAADALYCGLADWYVHSQQLTRLDRQLDTLIWQTNPLKDLQGVLANVGSQHLPDPGMAMLRPAIDHFFALPDIASIIEQLRAVTLFDTHHWAVATADILQSRSPLAMAVTLELLRRGRRLPLQACFAQELHLDRQWFERGDLIEGIRAMIIDKDKKPHWNPSHVSALDARHVASFFSGQEA